MINYRKLFEDRMQERCLSAFILSGGRTNVNFRIVAPSGEYVMRVPGEGTCEYIDRKREISNLKTISIKQYVPDIVYSEEEEGIVISRFLKGARNLRSEDMNLDETIEKVCKILADVHFSNIRFSGNLDMREMRDGYAAVLAKAGYTIPNQFQRYTSVLDEVLDRLYSNYYLDPVPSHGDPNLNNYMIRNNELFLVDWEYSGMADPYFDLATFVMTDCFDKEMEERILSAYETASHETLSRERFRFFKIAMDYMWSYWHFIKLSKNQMTNYNENAWRTRLARALSNLKGLEL